MTIKILVINVHVGIEKQKWVPSKYRAITNKNSSPILRMNILKIRSKSYLGIERINLP